MRCNNEYVLSQVSRGTGEKDGSDYIGMDIFTHLRYFMAISKFLELTVV